MPTASTILNCVALAGVAILAAGEPIRAEHNWPRWRGPSGDGHSTEQGIPVTWSDLDIEWRTSLPGYGQSSPVVWGERIFLTAATDGGRERVVLCVDRGDGRIRWQHVAWRGEPEETHKMNMFASASCVTDGERVVAFFGRAGIYCYDMDGKLIWQRQLGPLKDPWGTAASPVIVGDLVIQNCDADEDAFLLALHKQTGDEVWRTARENFRGWSTPILIHTADRDELVLNGHAGVNAYDPLTGKDLWFCRGSIGRGTPTVTPAGSLLISVAGKTGGDMFAVRPGGNGTVNSTHEVWRIKRQGGRDLPSPLVLDDYLLIVTMSGVAFCHRASTGEELWRTRLGGNYSGSPIAANGLAYICEESGETVVIRPGPEPDIVARNRITAASDEIFRATLTPTDGQFLCRSSRALYCIGKRAGK